MCLRLENGYLKKKKIGLETFVNVLEISYADRGCIYLVSKTVICDILV